MAALLTSKAKELYNEYNKNYMQGNMEGISMLLGYWIYIYHCLLEDERIEQHASCLS